MISTVAPADATPSRHIDRPLSVWTLLVATSIYEAMLLILPSFVGAIGDDLQLSPERVGLLGSADLIGIAASTATGPLWLRRVRWKRTGIGSLVAFLVFNAACFRVTDFGALMTLRFITGLIAGVGYTLGLAGVMDTTRSDRNAGLLLVVEVVFSALGLYVIAAVPVPWRLD